MLDSKVTNRITAAAAVIRDEDKGTRMKNVLAAQLRSEVSCLKGAMALERANRSPPTAIRNIVEKPTASELMAPTMSLEEAMWRTQMQATAEILAGDDIDEKDESFDSGFGSPASKSKDAQYHPAIKAIGTPSRRLPATYAANLV